MAPLPCRWRVKYARTTVNELKRIEEFEAENDNLKRTYAAVALNNTASKRGLSRKLQGRLRGARSSRC